MVERIENIPAKRIVFVTRETHPLCINVYWFKNIPSVTARDFKTPTIRLRDSNNPASTAGFERHPPF